MARIVSTATAVPEHLVYQQTARTEMAGVCEDHPHLRRLLPLFDRTGVESRHFVHPPAWYAEAHTFEERNDEYVTHGVELAVRVASDCLGGARVDPGDIDQIYFVTTTGLATPSIDALLAGRLGLRPDVRRFPIFGLGCAAGAGGLARAADAVAPGERALVVSLELCSLVFSPTADTPTDLVGAALFGDGAAAALVCGDEVATTGPAVRLSRSHLFADAQDLMGWRFTDNGMRLVLSRDIPTFVAARVRPVVEQFLADAGLTPDGLAHHVLHPGGPKVMATYRSAFGFSEEAVGAARDSMRRFGNLSSAAVLFMLHDVMTSGRPRPDDTGLVMALGPGFAAEMLALSW